MTDTNPTPHVKVTLDAIYTELLAIRSELAALNVESVTKDVEDHETRIRSLERWVWGAAGLGTIGGAGLSQILSRLFGG